MVPVVLTLGLTIVRTASASDGSTTPTTPAAAAEPDGAAIWSRDCSFCHGVRGGGSNQGPSITSSGTALVDFVVRTGRMPLPFQDGADQSLFASAPPMARGRRPSAYTPEEIDALVAYTSSFVTGPVAVPPPDTEGADVGRGGEIFRLQCAACHQMAGAGGALAYGDVGPPLDHATPQDVVEAMRTGPGNMPVFDASTISDREATDVASYVAYLQDPDDRGGFSLWHLGPVPEGLVAWAVGIVATVLLCRWLGDRERPVRR